MNLIQRIEARLVEEWREALQWWSVRWAALGALLLPLMQLVPVFPLEIQALLPVWLRAPIAGAWCLVFIALRMQAQKKPHGQ